MSKHLPENKGFNYPIFTLGLNELPAVHQTLINTLNQYSYCIAEKDSEFKEALQNSDVLLPDGIAIVAAVKLLWGKTIKKIAGADLHQHYLENLNAKNGSCFYLGSSNDTLDKIKKRLQTEYPNIKTGFYSPPYKLGFSDKDNEQMIAAINNFKPDVLFIGMTAPKQEKWAYQHKLKLDAQIIASIGAVFDFYAGTINRPNKIWINLGMEWFIRLVKEPKRMWKRYLYYGPLFMYDILNKKFNFL